MKLHPIIQLQLRIIHVQNIAAQAIPIQPSNFGSIIQQMAMRSPLATQILNLRQLVDTVGCCQPEANQDIPLAQRIDHLAKDVSNVILMKEMFDCDDTQKGAHSNHTRNAKLALVFARVFRKAFDSQHRNVLLTQFQHLLFTANLPYATKRVLQQPLPMLIAYHRTNQDCYLQLTTKQIIHQQIQLQTTNNKDGHQQQARNQRCLFVLMMMDNFVEYAASCQNSDYTMLIAELFVCFRKLLQRLELDDGRVALYGQWLGVCRRYFAQLGVFLSKNESKKNMLRQCVGSLIQKLELYRLGLSILEYRGVHHEPSQVASPYCPQCTQEMLQQLRKEVLELRTLYFELILSTVRLSEGLQLTSLMLPGQQFAIVNWISSGIFCYVLQPRTITNPLNINVSETEYKLQSVLVELYYLVTSKVYNNIESVIDRYSELNETLLLPLLQFSPYQLYLFEHESQLFLDIIQNFSSPKAQIDSPKSKSAVLIKMIVEGVPTFQAEFTLMCKFYLERAMQCAISGFEEMTQYVQIYRMSTEACLLLLTLFAPSLRSEQSQVSYLRELLRVGNVVRLDDISLALVLQLAVRIGKDVLTTSNQQIDAIDLGLCSKRQTLKMAALRCLLDFSRKRYYPRHVRDLLYKLEEDEEKEQADCCLLMWDILKTTISLHLNSIPASALNDLVLSVKKVIIKQILSQLTTTKPRTNNPTRHLTLINSLDFCVVLLQHIGQTKLTTFLWDTLIEMGLLYQYVKAIQIKEEVLKLIRQIGRYAILHSKDFPVQLLKLIPVLLVDLQKYGQILILAVLQLFSVGIGRMGRPKLLRKLHPIYHSLIALLDRQLNKPLLEDTNQIYAYCLMIVLNRMVLYFGSQINKQDLFSLVVRCRKILDRQGVQLIKQRATCLIFGCSLYLREATMFATMDEYIVKSQISSYQKQMVLSTLQIFFSSKLTVGGVGKYIYLTRILYHLMQKSHQFQQKHEKQQKTITILDNFLIRCNTMIQFEDQIVKVYQLFKTCKGSVYLYWLDIAEPVIKREFYQREVLSMGKNLLVCTSKMVDYSLSEPHFEGRQRLNLLKFNPLVSQGLVQDEFICDSKLIHLCIHQDEYIWKQNKRPVYKVPNKKTKMM